MCMYMKKVEYSFAIFWFNAILGLDLWVKLLFFNFFHIGIVEAILSIRYKLLETNSKKKKTNSKQAKEPKQNKKKIYKRANEEYITHAQ